MSDECGACDADELREQNELLSDRIDELRAENLRLSEEVARLRACEVHRDWLRLELFGARQLRDLLEEALDLAEYEGIGCGGCENDRCRTCEPARIRERARKVAP